MKRSNSINKSLMKKRSKVLPVTLVAASTSMLFIGGCGDPKPNAADMESVVIYKSLGECIADAPSKAEECKLSYSTALEDAKKTAPKYYNQADCETDFGSKGCYKPENTNFFMPFMAGFVVSNMLTNRSSMPLYNSTSYNSPYYGWSGYNGTRYGSNTTRITMSSSDWGKVKSQKATSPSSKSQTASRTISRGGFGSVASSKSSWSSRSSSRRSGGWGG